ncbi:hypothetical protein [Streptomyces cavernicola]|uniref:DUF2975 domain-containing protein n=1 Tax=Streptomyces cavernicola TaxID=3043613 RepID=A0ABT6SCW9_9ACTN|nr:hypothetical protein [Streptomyces sp. B-S-A6]MDI3405502.1 hypothetical protein [Streptomyces sp. B-S-A6]
MSRLPLPPPPPPPHLRTWPDRDALLSDRADALKILHRRSLGLFQLGRLWLLALLALCGWSGVAGAVQMGTSADGFPIDVFIAVLVAAVGLAVIAPAVLVAVLWLRRQQRIGQLRDAWLLLDSDEAADNRLRSPALSLTWMLLSFAMCGLGILSSYSAAATAAGSAAMFQLFLGMGGGMIIWVTGLLGIHRAFRHRQWVLSRLGDGSGRGSGDGDGGGGGGGGAHQSTH